MAALDELFGIVREEPVVPPEERDAIRHARRARHYANTIGRMLEAHGPGPAHTTCGACLRLIKRGRYFKCAKARITRGAATDWRSGWPACGAFAERD